MNMFWRKFKLLILCCAVASFVPQQLRAEQTKCANPLCVECNNQCEPQQPCGSCKPERKCATKKEVARIVKHATQEITTQIEEVIALEHTIISLIDTIECPQSSSCESLITQCCATLNSKIDQITNNTDIIIDLDNTIISKIDSLVTNSSCATASALDQCCLVLESKIDEVANNTNTLVSMLDQCCFTLESKLDLISVNTDCATASALDACCFTIESKLDSLSLSTDCATASALDACCFTIESKLDLISVNTDCATASALDACCFTIESKLDSLSLSTDCATASALDACCFTIESKLDSLSTPSVLANPCDATPISAPTIITSPGYYCLTKDISATGTGIQIDSSNVVVDLNNHNIFSTATSSGVVVSPGFSNVTIQNGSIFGDNASFSLDEGINLPFAGVYLNGVSNVKLKNILVQDWTLGVYFFNSDGLLVDDVRSLYNLLGVTSILSDDVKIYDSYVKTNTLSGFIFAATNNVDIQNCNFAENIGTACSISNAQCVNVNNCNVSQVSAGDGFNFSSTITGANITNCTVCGAQNGFSFNNGLVQGIIRECTAQNNQTGFRNQASPSTSMQFYSNMACDNVQNFVGVTQAPVSSPAAAQGVMNIDCSSSAVDTVSDLCLPTALVGPAPITISSPGYYCLSQDLVDPAFNSAITINANDVVLDLNNHTITIPAGGTGIFLSNNVNNVIIKNGLIDDTAGGATGVSLLGSNSHVTVNSVSIEGAAIGIGVTSSSSIILQNNFFDNVGTGCSLSTSTNIQISNCNFHHDGLNSGVGINASQIFATSISDCFFKGLSIGISISTAMQNLVIKNCQLQDMGADAILIFSSGFSRGLVIDGCSAQGLSSSPGIVCAPSAGAVLKDVVIKNCIASKFNNVAFSIGSSSGGVTNAVVSNCIAQESGSGFLVQDSLSNPGSVIVEHCTAQGNTTGFSNSATTSTNAQFYANRACNNTTNYSSVVSAPVTSPANARGVYNVDCNNSSVDEIDTILSKVLCLAALSGC